MWLIFFGRVLRSAALFGDHMGSFRNPRVVFWKGQLVCGRKSERCFFDGTDLAGLDMIHSGWWFGTFSIFPYIGMSSFQLTFIFFRGVGQPPTRYRS